jgi:hypothetical protein
MRWKRLGKLFVPVQGRARLAIEMILIEVSVWAAEGFL